MGMLMNPRMFIIILGNLTAFGPFITDFYLPCLPELMKFFSVPMTLVQTSLTAGMWGLAFGQLAFGPLCDKFGRKRPLLWCLALFVLATAGCMAASSMDFFIFCRLLQGFSGAGGLVISKAMVADAFDTSGQARVFAILAAIQGASPIVAPVVGGLAFSLFSWQAAFALLGGWGLVLFCLCRRLEETLPDNQRLSLPLWKAFSAYRPILANRRYLLLNLLQSFASGALLSYIAASPFIFQEYFGLSPMNYGLVFAANSLGLVGGSCLVMKTRNFVAVLGWSVGCIWLAGVVAATLLWLGFSLVIFDVALVCMLFCVGIITPLAMTLALDAVAVNRGAASALLGSFPFMLGGIVAPLTGLGNIIHSMDIIMIACITVCAGLWLMLRPVIREKRIS